MTTHSDPFEVARQLPEAERAAYLAVACPDPAQRAAIEARLEEAARADEFFETLPDVKSPSPPAAPSEEPGDQVGPYTLRQRLGEGGFGTVWMAEQKQPLSRMVALKVVKAGMDTRQVLARFEAERQALTMMDHPNIAKVLDAGATTSGRPYFAMELVKGLPITTFCDHRKLDTRARLELFKDVCSAVNHAHQKGIIHRDLKPSNIIVSLHGDKPVPKVIDFGIAKAMHGKLTDQTLFTRFEQFLGTPAYMSPEQTELSGLDIDTRSDIYSLGVLLYEILAGRPPFDPSTLLSAGYDEMRRIIREVDPPRPSLRLTGLTQEEATTLTTTHQAQPQKLGRLLRGELDWVIMKAIDKDRGRRYETANALAADLARYLADEPVMAAAPSRLYKIRKFARRHKGAFTAAAAIVLALVAGTIVSTWQALRATKAEELATSRLTESEQARLEAEDLSTFMQGVLQSPDPARDGRTITVAETLDAAAKRLETDLAGQPARKAKLQAALGWTYYSLGLYQQAIPLWKQALAYHREASGPRHPDTLTAAHNLAVAYLDTGRRQDAMEILEEVLKVRREVLGMAHPDTATTATVLAASYYAAGEIETAVRLGEEALRMFQIIYGEVREGTISTMGNLAEYYHAAGRREEALRMREEVLSLSREVLGARHVGTLIAMGTLATSYATAARLEEAIQLGEETLGLMQDVLGDNHPHTLTTMQNLGGWYSLAGRLDELVRTSEEVLARTRKALGEKHPHTLTAMANLASALAETGRNREALALRETVVSLHQEMLGRNHPLTLSAMERLAHSYAESGRGKEAMALLEEVVAVRRSNLGEKHPDTTNTMHSLAEVYRENERLDEARKLGREVLVLRREAHGDKHPETANAMNTLANAHQDAGALEEARILREQVLEIRSELLGKAHPDTIAAMNNLASVHIEAGRNTEAVKLGEAALAVSHEIAADKSPTTLFTMYYLGKAYHALRRRDETLEMREDLLKLSSEVLGESHALTLRSMGDLAESYFDGGRKDEALRLRERLLTLRREVTGASHPDTLEAMRRLAAWYQDLGKSAEAEALRKELAAAEDGEREPTEDAQER